MTPHELNLHIQVYAEHNRREIEEGLTLAYMTAYWHRVKRMPDLKKLIQDTRPRVSKTPEQLLAQVKAINAAMGGVINEGGI
ncbi:hypothetical protein K0T92_14495 [Paenibacillus oenotherae]|uniref:Uncharacterized protein n=1 Tax=Paenibacillus oenotherae TaxID=1435645 RepID=A0ABS7D7N4_9BACL|nr:hypothetical protein [Paenibacillus oenotherae]MBW7475952.1 hypothetical protein [Paenibacillus oenotherae]